jgi:hypothetical protein
VLTADVVTVNVADVVPAATTTDDGTTALELLLDKLTDVPPDAAGPFSVTVPVDLRPPDTVAGFKLTKTIDAGVTFKVADLAPAPVPAVIVAVV